MPLGGSTQQFRSYGKRKTNVINKRQALDGWDATSAGPATGGARDDSSESSSSSGDSEEEERAIPRPAARKRVPVARAKEAVVELVVEAPSLRRRPTARPSQIPSRPRTHTFDKENSLASSHNSINHPAPPKQPTVQRVPLSLKGRQPAKAPVSPTAARTTEAEKLSTSELEDSEDVVDPVKRAGNAARRRLVIPDDDEESTASPTSPTFVKPSATQPASSVSFPEVTAEAVPSTDASSTCPPVDAAPLAPKTRRRSVHPSALLPRRLPSASTHPAPTAIAPLLPLLLCPTIFSFTSFISSPPSPPFSSAPFPLWRKIGEASFSEVFVTDAGRGEDLVVKIIPVAPADPTMAKAEEELPYVSDWEAVMREIEVSRALGGEDGLDGFVKFKGAFIVQGSYPQELLASWDEYKASQYLPSDEQIRPHVLPSSQLYALILLSHAGSDLETYKLKSWRDAASVLVQVTQTLSVAEDLKGFEHRDLHWGNILVRPVSSAFADMPRRLASLRLFDPASCDTDSEPSAPLSHFPFLSSPRSIRATLIDFTLSRCALPNDRVAADPFEDECIFQGERDLQFEVYRWMREVVEREGGRWEGRHARTNVLWLYYLVHKLLYDKKLRLPGNISAQPASVFPSSLARPAPSPRKPVRRVSFFASSSSLPLSPIAPSRMIRTMPASYLPGGRNHSLYRKDQEEEREAWEWLKGVEGELNKCLEGWGLRPGTEGRKGSAKKAGPKSRKVVARSMEDGFASAGEVWRWMAERGEEGKR
ncbi:other/Haspin protein kinase [Rhodotorula toruloides]|uniref:non-specific serine/threonine protein kinase n=1 Tax=Rhodotorula toruloides TaxID=5286 RepID=A0A511KAQ8_RHOTO|nr:other/Haspin protein kinase [Rhodotorula toruloides]